MLSCSLNEGETECEDQIDLEEGAFIALSYDGGAVQLLYTPNYGEDLQMVWGIDGDIFYRLNILP